MPDKTDIRLAREQAGLSRQQLADMLGTTVHHYWQVDMGTAAADPELTVRAWKALGGTAPSGGRDGQGSGIPADSEESSGPWVWVCTLCKWEYTSEIYIQAMDHPCPKRSKTGTSKMHAMVRKIL